MDRGINWIIDKSQYCCREFKFSLNQILDKLVEKLADNGILRAAGNSRYFIYIHLLLSSEHSLELEK